MKKDILFFDATLRDGSHAVKHQITTETITKFCTMADGAGLYTIVTGHGNGLGASTIQVGLAKHSDEEMLKAAAAALKKTKLGVYMIPGFGTINDNLKPAIACGVEVFKIGSHCTEADTTKEHIEFLAKHGKEVYGVLMSAHMSPPEVLLEETKKMQSYGALGVILMDSAGALLPEDVKARIDLLTDKTVNLKIGYHGHNNLGLAVSNSLLAIDRGAGIIDGTIMGFGAGAGNCQLEVLFAILQKQGRLNNIDLYKIMDTAEEVVAKDLKFTKAISQLSIISGMCGVFSAFSEKVNAAAKRFDVDPRDIFVELGKHQVVGGQEDMVIDVAMNLAQKKKKDNTDDMIESLL